MLIKRTYVLKKFHEFELFLYMVMSVDLFLENSKGYLLRVI